VDRISESKRIDL